MEGGREALRTDQNVLRTNTHHFEGGREGGEEGGRDHRLYSLIDQNVLRPDTHPFFC